MKRHPRQPNEAPPPRVKNIVSEADRQALEESYSFLPPARATNNNNDNNHQNRNDASAGSSWQDRMVRNYHDHLYKEFALTDLSRGAGRIGLRWRTQQEVKDGRGEITCGNKHCVHSKNYSSTTLQSLTTLEVPFAYEERGEKKKELVKLRLCSNCLPLVSTSKQRPASAGTATTRDKQSRVDDEKEQDSSSSSSGSSTASSEHRRDKKKRCKRRREKERSRTKKKRRQRDDG